MMNCPTCHRPSTYIAPCSECWRTMAPTEKVGWIYLLRTTTAPAHAALVAAIGHRDPVKNAPPTLRAYVEFLEAELSAREVYRG